VKNTLLVHQGARLLSVFRQKLVQNFLLSQLVS